MLVKWTPEDTYKTFRTSCMSDTSHLETNHQSKLCETVAYFHQSNKWQQNTVQFIYIEWDPKSWSKSPPLSSPPTPPPST